MTLPAIWLFGAVALRFDLDGVTTMFNSPHAAQLFWACFFVLVFAIVALSLWFYRRMRPH